MKLRLLIWASVLALVLDQLSKYVVIHAMGLARVLNIEVLPPLLTFRYGENRGINFGLFGDGSDAQRWILIGLSCVVAVAVAIWIVRSSATPVMQIAAGLLIGGALGNAIDRLLYGYVLDFLNMSCCGIDNPFVFNVADIFIFAGAIGLVFLDSRRNSEKSR